MPCERPLIILLCFQGCSFFLRLGLGLGERVVQGLASNSVCACARVHKYPSRGRPHSRGSLLKRHFPFRIQAAISILSSQTPLTGVPQLSGAPHLGTLNIQ